MLEKSVLVTGSRGFIGSHLVDYLHGKGLSVIGTDFSESETFQEEITNTKVPFYDIDVRQKQDKKWDSVFSEHGIGTVFHCAAYAAEIMSLYRPAFISETNIVGSTRLMEAAIRNNAERFVFLSSNSVYGCQEKCPYGEDAQKKPDDVYAVGKLATEETLRILGKVHGMDCTIIRPHNVYGPRQKLNDPYRNVIGIWMNMIMQGKKPVVYGDGMQERAFTYIEDFIWPVAEAGTTPKGRNETFNIGTHEHTTLKRAAEVVCEAMGSKDGFGFAEARKQEVKISYPSSEKAKKLLGFEAKWGFEQGVKKMAEWAKAQPKKSFEYFGSVEIEKNLLSTWKEKSL